MPFSRSSGILLHPTSLPSRFGIGDLGPEAFSFVDFLSAGGQRLWQVLPLGPTGYGDSPYMCFSAMAGNPLLLSLEILRDKSLLDDDDLNALPSYPNTIDYGRVITEKFPLLKKAWRNFRDHGTSDQRMAFEQFCELNAHWLDDFALFMALKEHFHGKPWVKWNLSLVKRKRDAMKKARGKYTALMGFHRFLQFEFHQQISALRSYANQRKVSIIGDLPIYVAHDSAEVWAKPEYFDIDKDTGTLFSVAGVPPDYFSATGQLWGNPIYNWEQLKQDGFEWWIQRFIVLLGYVDAVRIDHFRGFEAYWRVKYGEETAINGEWVSAPGEALFKRLYERFGYLPVIAEDLGVITPEVEQLRDDFNLPGMKILQFAFSTDDENTYLPPNYTENCVVYTGTHDNDTTQGWFQSLTKIEKARVLKYLKSDNPENIHWDLVNLAYLSVAKMAIVPLQDVLGLPANARMNTPSKKDGNWTWRFESQMMTGELRDKLLALTIKSGRAS
ncbi:MAG: 4-alpha-glucanotransferase [Candidatus Methylumidiphilus sp.]